MYESKSVRDGFESHSRRRTTGFIQRRYKRDAPIFLRQRGSNIMPFQSLTKYRQEGQNEGTELSCASSVSVSEEDLDLERKIDAITRYHKPYTKKILLTMARYIVKYLKSTATSLLLSLGCFLIIFLTD
jgi:predicted ATPase